jgi:hypothetical protein
VDWAAVTSWIGAGVALATAILTIGREWWRRPQVDWTISGEVSQPDRLVPHSVEAVCIVSNFGDGNAHRVSVHVQRGDAPRASIEASSPLLRPGDNVKVTFRAAVVDWPDTTVFITWTPPPIRRRKEHTSEPQRVADLTHPTERAWQALKAAQPADHTGSTDSAPPGPGTRP